jgi:hypothetical protein
MTATQLSNITLAPLMVGLFALTYFLIRRTTKEIITHMDELKAQVEAQTQVEQSAIP